MLKLHPFTRMKGIRCFPQLHDQESRYVVESWCFSFISMFFWLKTKNIFTALKDEIEASWSSEIFMSLGNVPCPKRFDDPKSKKWIPGNALARRAGDGGFAVEWFPKSCPQPDRLVCPGGYDFFVSSSVPYFCSRKKRGGFHRLITASNRSASL